MTSKGQGRHVPWFLLPFYALWRLLGVTLELTGRITGIALGLVLMIVGVIVSLTVVGAVVGIPLAVLGFMLMVRGLF